MNGLGRSHALALDAADELAPFRDEFVISDEDVIYLDGNSLGRAAKRSLEALRCAGDDWARQLVGGWNASWFTLPQRVGAMLAALLGAEADEVIACDSTSVNLFKLALAALPLRPGRRKIVTDALNFPSDLYVLRGALQLAGDDYELVIVPSADGITMDEARLAAAIDDDTALVALTLTAYKSGFTYDLERLTALAHRAGALMLWDVCHAVGAMPIALGVCGADLAVGCTYKYLSGGPGAPAFLYVRRDLQAQLSSPIRGWWSHRAMFDFSLDYAPADGVNRFLAGSPNVLSLVAVEPAVELVLEAGLDRIRAKAIAQTEYLIELWDAWLRPLGMTLNSPRAAVRRGAHVSLGHPDGWRLNRALLAAGVVPDFRPLDNLRFGCAPLYTTFREIHAAMSILRDILAERRYEQFSDERAMVT